MLTRPRFHFGLSHPSTTSSPALGESPALVLVDLNASGISAATLISQVKEKDSAPTTIAFAGQDQEDLQKQARSAGADRVMTKQALSSELSGILEGLREES